MAKKQQGQSQKEQYAAYKNQGRYAKNKTAKLERHLKAHPEDVQAQKALDNMRTNPSRQTPNSYRWKASQMEYAHQLASLGYNGNAALGGKDEAKAQEEVIGFGVKQILDIPPKQRDGKPKKK